MYIGRAIIGFVTAQTVKVIIEMARTRRFDFRRVVDTGGMPSAHAAGTVALTSSLWRDFGLNEPAVAVAFVFTLITLYDAAGIRRAAGKQAFVLNKIMDELKEDWHIKEERLKELLGHTPLQVLMGILLGLLVGFW